MYNRMLKLPLDGNSSIFLFGPRGTGKTLWVKHALPNAVYLDLLSFTLYKDLSANPGRLIDLIPKNFSDWIVIDEVQRVPELLNEVHRLIEEYHYKFLLTGSSARSLRRSGVNLLAGRALRYHMHTLIVQELGQAFNLGHALKLGLLPATFTQSEPQKYLETYVQTYVREEVLQEGLTRNIHAFSRFLEVASLSQGSIVNIAEIAREVGIDRQVVRSYFEILNDLLLGQFILPFTRRSKRRLVVHPKFYFFDVGVYRILRPRGPLDTQEELDGAGLETLFLQSLLAINDYQEFGYSIHFWRTSTNLEVDFVIYGERGLHAFEIKRSSTVSGKDLNGLLAFQKDYPEAKLYFIYSGNRKEYRGDIQLIPMEEMLQILPEILK
jgi:predicted AAA+ superfamily ATPase